MVLSTANLDVTTNISGLAAMQHIDVSLVATLHPVSPDRLLVSVPRSITGRSLSAFALQTYDLNTDRELGRQALTRNSTTVVQASSTSSQLEPNVKHLEASADGKWLATVEEWHADPRELEGVTLMSGDDVDQFGAETCLKVWLYSDQQSEWELVNRIDSPHSDGRTEVLALASNPTRNEFASAGSDGKVRIWRPRSRVRDGVPVRNEAGEQLYNWSQAAVVACTSLPRRTDGHSDSAALAYSPDGTVIAASWSQSTSTPRWTYFLDSEEAAIRHSVPSLLTRGPASIVFSDRYLVSLSDTICIYDTVTATTISSITLEKAYRSPTRRGYLAANSLDGTVAIAVNAENKSKPGRLVVINVHDLERGSLLDHQIPAQTHALLTSPAKQGYVIIDGTSRIRHLKRSTGTAPPGQTVTALKESEDVRRGLDRIFGQKQTTAQPTLNETSNSLISTEEQPAMKTLDEALSFPTSASAPSVSGLFERIVGLFSRRTAGA